MSEDTSTIGQWMYHSKDGRWSIWHSSKNFWLLFDNSVTIWESDDRMRVFKSFELAKQWLANNADKEEN